MKLVLQHPHRQGEISGVLTSLQEMLPELASRPDMELRIVSTRDASWREQIAAVRWADAVMLNSNCLSMALAGRLLFRPTLLKIHYLQYQTVHWRFDPMPFGRRMITELRHLLRSGAGHAYVAAGVGRLLARTAVAFLVHRVSACSGFCATQTALPRTVHVLRNPIRIAAGLPPRTAEDLDRPYRFVFIGRVTRDKGWDTLVDAAALLARGGRDFRIDVIGDGDDRAAMEHAVAAAGQAQRFRFLGRLDAAATHGAIANALCALMPSRFQEPAGYIPLEAAACRVPSIVARVGGLPETAGPDCPSFAAGCAEEMAGHMGVFLDDPARALAAGHAAYLRAARLFAPQRIADELLHLLQGGPAPAPAC